MEKSKNILDYISIDDIQECLSQLGLYKHLSDKKKFAVDDSLLEQPVNNKKIEEKTPINFALFLFI